MASNLRTFIVANPTSGAGSVDREWDVIERQLKNTLGEYDVAFTKGPGHATLLTREALRAGWEMVVAVGGDGTLNEVVNGFFERPEPKDHYQLQAEGWLHWRGTAPEPINKDAVLGMIPMGTGGDFRRTVGLMGGWREAVGALKGDNTRTIDVGQVGFIGHEGKIETCFFINIAGGGLSGAVDDVVNKSSKRLGGTVSFALAAFKAFSRYSNPEIELRMDEVDEVRQRITTFVAANGQYFGGGMWIAPGASITDGQLQVVTLGDLGKIEAVPTLARVYSGTHLGDEKVWRRQAKIISARCLDRGAHVLLDIDGEQPGRLPATFHVHSRAIQLKI